MTLSDPTNPKDAKPANPNDTVTPASDAPVVELAVETGPISSPRSGRLVGVNDQGRPLVDYPGNPFGPLRARTTVVLAAPALERAVEDQCAVLLLFEDGDPGRPIVVGLLHDQMPVAAPSGPTTAEVEIDGQPQRVELAAQDELVLRCGQASLVLRRNGRVLVRGTYVETRSKGVNRIKGGSVQIN